MQHKGTNYIFGLSDFVSHGLDEKFLMDLVFWGIIRLNL
jgi:hypothetical protein